jgi:hypothetical protein
MKKPKQNKYCRLIRYKCNHLNAIIDKKLISNDLLKKRVLSNLLHNNDNIIDSLK